MRGQFIFEAGQSEEDEAVDEGGEDNHEAHQHQLQARHGSHLDMNHQNYFLENLLTEYFHGL